MLNQPEMHGIPDADTVSTCLSRCRMIADSGVAIASMCAVLSGFLSHATVAIEALPREQAGRAVTIVDYPHGSLSVLDYGQSARMRSEVDIHDDGRGDRVVLCVVYLPGQMEVPTQVLRSVMEAAAQEFRKIGRHLFEQVPGAKQLQDLGLRSNEGIALFMRKVDRLIMRGDIAPMPLTMAVFGWKTLQPGVTRGVTHTLMRRSTEILDESIRPTDLTAMLSPRHIVVCCYGMWREVAMRRLPRVAAKISALADTGDRSLVVGYTSRSPDDGSDANDMLRAAFNAHVAAGDAIERLSPPPLFFVEDAGTSGRR